MTSALSYRDDDEAGLGKTVCARAHTCERIIHSLDLRTRIYVINYRINLCRVEIKWFIHHSVEVRNAVCSLHLEEFRELVAVGEKLREVTLLHIHHLVAVVVKKDCHRHGVDARIIVKHVAGIVINLCLMEIIPLGNLLETGTVKIHTIEMLVIRILVCVLSVSCEIYHSCLLVHLEHLLHMPCTLGESVLEITLTVI